MVSAADRRLLTKDKVFAIPNFAEEAEMLKWAGVSFGEETTLMLGKSIKVSFKFYFIKPKLNFDCLLFRDWQ